VKIMTRDCESVYEETEKAWRSHIASVKMRMHRGDVTLECHVTSTSSSVCDVADRRDG